MYDPNAISFKAIWRKERDGTTKKSSSIAIGFYRGYKIVRKITAYVKPHRVNTYVDYYIDGIEPNPYNDERQCRRRVDELIKQKEASNG